MSKTTNKINWVKVLEAIVQALIAALTALGVSSCKANGII
ncbi:MAG: smalltalk protein [Prevotella sp.]|nr:smalltalk protein [Prevotella sp.]